MLIMHHGHSEFLMESADGYRILTDPFDDHVGYPMHTVDCDAVTVTHGHGDHSYVQKAQGAQVIVDHAGTVHLTPEITVTGIPCWHDDQQGKLRGPNLIFIYEIDGLRVAHFGDLGAWDEELAARLEDIDILMIPVGGFFTINAASAARLIERIKPRMVLPMHYKTDANASWPIAPLDGCLAALGAQDAPRMPLLRVTKEDLSEQPRIAILTDRA